MSLTQNKKSDGALENEEIFCILSTKLTGNNKEISLKKT